MIEKAQIVFDLITKNHEWSQIYVIFVASLSGISSMGLTSWPSPSIPILTSNLSNIEVISVEEASYFSVIPALVTLVLSPLTAILVDVIGRKQMVILITVPQIICWTIIAMAKNLTYLYVSRCMSGIADALIYCVIPVYIGEISTPNIRGTWGNLFIMFLYVGQFFMNIIGSYCTIQTTALIFITIPIIQFTLALFLPESPYFLLIKRQDSEAEQSLKRLRRNKNVQDEFYQLRQFVEQQISEPASFKHLFLISSNRKSLMICVALRIFQQFSGIITFSVYTQQIFIQAGGINYSTSAIVFCSALVVIGIIYLFVVNRLGRRHVMLLSSSLTALILFIKATYLFLKLEVHVDMSDFNWMPLTIMIFYLTVSVGGLGMLPVLMLGELFSSNFKGKAMGVVTVFSYLCLLVVPKLFHYLSMEYGMYIPFLLFAVCTTMTIPFYYFVLPETRGKTLEEIQSINHK